MARKDKIKEIRKMDEQLAVERSLLKLDGRLHLATIKSKSPYWLVGGGLVLGLVAGQLGRVASTGLFSMGLEAARLWRMANLWMPGTPGDTEIPPGVDA